MLEDRNTFGSPVDTGDEIDAVGGQNILGVDHVAIAVRDLERAVDWYTSNFGFQILERRLTRGERTAMRSAVLKAGNAFLVLLEGTTSESQVAKFIQRFGCGVQHMALQVKDLGAALQQLSVRGTGVDTPIITDEGIRQVFLHRDERSGVRLELIERKGGTFTDQSVEQLFRTFEANDFY